MNKYDGYNFKVYKNTNSPNSLAGNDVRTLYLDPKTNNLWIGTLEGISIYNTSLDKFTTYRHEHDNDNSISSNHIGAILRDSKDRLWIGTSKGLNLFNEEDSTFQLFKINEKPINNTIEVIFEDSEANIWIGGSGGLYLLQEEATKFKFERLDLLWGLKGKQVTDIEEDSNETLWIGTSDGGFSKVSKERSQTENFTFDKNNKNSLSHNSVRDICIDQKNQIWIGTLNGLNLFDPKTNNFTRLQKDVSSNQYFPDNSIKALHEDRRGSLWVGTYFKGVIHVDEAYNQFQNFVYSPYKKGLNAEVISSFAEDENGNLWIGTEGGGLNFYDVKKGTYSSFQYEENNPNSLSGNHVKQLLLDGDSLWIGTFNQGYNILDIKTFKNTRHAFTSVEDNTITSGNVYGFLKQGKRMWMITYGGGLNIYDTSSRQYHIYQHNPKDTTSINTDFLRSIFRSSDGKIWIGGSNGLNRVIIGDDGLPESFETFLENEKVYSIAEDYKGNLYFGTIGSGFFVLDAKDGIWRNYTEEGGLPGNRVYGILEDNNNLMWLSTNDGLSRFDYNKNSFINFNKSNGLSNSEFNYNGYFKCKNGDLLFGGIDGYTRFNPDNIQANTYIPPVVFTKLHQNNRELSTENNSSILPNPLNELEEIKFKYNEANFTIEFASLDFFSPKNNSYAFMLEGVDRAWNYTTGNPSATYTLQNPGDYLFRLKGSNSDGIWNPKERLLEITVLPPPWRTWWAYMIYCAIAIAGILAVIRYLRLRTSLKLEKLEKQQQDELHQMKLRFFTNIAHEFRTPLTLIIGPIEELLKSFANKRNPIYQQKLKNIHSNSKRLLNLVNQLMTFRKMETGHDPLQLQSININHFLEEIYHQFKFSAEEKDIEYRLEKPEYEIKLWGDKQKLEKVFYNLLSNAFKFTPPGGRITLCLDQVDENVEILVKDTGRGIDVSQHEEIFQRFYEKNTNASFNLIKGSGVGLSLSKQIVELHHGKIEVLSTLNEGATFKVVLVLGKNHFSDDDFAQESDVMSSSFGESVDLMSLEPSVIPILHRDLHSTNTKILIVDDNPEVLDYLSSIFASEYVVITAKDGAEGYEKSKKYAPELILSDYMMPELNGLEFCKQIKNDFETSHIPFILLTAKAEMEDRLSGLNIGANDYIAKPFHPDELKFKVSNIINQRKKLKDSFKDKISFTPAEIDLTSADEEFLEAFVKLIEENISNPEFKIDQISHELAVSRALLFNKVKSLTDMTPKNFIKEFRMKRAAQLLESGKLTISEIAYKVGFKEPKYFSKVFHKEFGTSPSEYIEHMSAH